MIIHPSVPATTVAEFITYARANPGKINMASAGMEAPAHGRRAFQELVGVNLVHVPYRGNDLR